MVHFKYFSVGVFCLQVYIFVTFDWWVHYILYYNIGLSPIFITVLKVQYLLLCYIGPGLSTGVFIIDWLLWQNCISVDSCMYGLFYNDLSLIEGTMNAYFTSRVQYSLFHRTGSINFVYGLFSLFNINSLKAFLASDHEWGLHEHYLQGGSWTS